MFSLPDRFSDEGGGVRGGIEQYCGDHPDTSSTCEMADKGANLLRKLLEGDRGGRVRGPTGPDQGEVATNGACVRGRCFAQGAVHEFACPARRAVALRVLDQPWPTARWPSDRQRAALTKIDREQLEAKLGWLRDYREAIEQ